MINANILLVQVQFFIISLLLKVVMISFSLDFVATRDLSGFNLKQFGFGSLLSWNFTQFNEENYATIFMKLKPNPIIVFFESWIAKSFF